MFALSPRNNQRILYDAYKEMIFDRFPTNGSEAYNVIRTNPKILMSEIDEKDSDRDSLICRLIFSGSLYSINTILMSNNTFVSNANPFYCGEELVEMPSIFLRSTRLNFYFSLVLFRFYNSKERLSEVIDMTDTGSLLRIKKNYRDEFYYNDTNPHYKIDIDEEVDAQQAQAYRERIVPWFMEKAFEIFQKECELSQLKSQGKSTRNVQFSLAVDYMRIFFMEDAYVSPRYFLEKVQEYESDFIKLLPINNFSKKTETDGDSSSESSVDLALENDNQPPFLSIQNLDNCYNSASQRVGELCASATPVHRESDNSSKSLAWLPQSQTWYRMFDCIFPPIKTPLLQSLKQKNS